MKTRSKQRHNAEWAARILATRDVQEAWTAFLAFEESGLRPSLSVFHAMFEKLIFEIARQVRVRSYTSLPGDGKEVLPVPDDNTSESEKSRIKPPTVGELYDQMIHVGLRPSGRCLALLVGHASSIENGVQYLMDSDLNRRSLAGLLGHQGRKCHSDLKHIPDQTFEAFITLLCRTAAKKSNVSTYTSYPQSDKSFVPLNSRNQTGLLLHAIELIKARQPHYRPIWYALFLALARTRIPSDALLPWKLLEALLKAFFDAGLELDPRGFLLICQALEYALISKTPEDNAVVSRGVQLLKDSFAKLSGIGQADRGLPALLHGIEGAHLHAYVRILGIAGERQEILAVMEWIVKNQEELELLAMGSGNGMNLLRRTLLAMRSFLDQGRPDEDVEALTALMNQVEGWGGWPSDEELEKYIERANI